MALDVLQSKNAVAQVILLNYHSLPLLLFCCYYYCYRYHCYSVWNGRNGSCRILVKWWWWRANCWSREGDTVNRMMSTSNKCKDSRIIEFITFVCTFLLMWQTIFRVADIAVQALFKFFCLVLLKLKPSALTCTTLRLSPVIVTIYLFLNHYHWWRLQSVAEMFGV